MIDLLLMRTLRTVSMRVKKLISNFNLRNFLWIYLFTTIIYFISNILKLLVQNVGNHQWGAAFPKHSDYDKFVGKVNFFEIYNKLGLSQINGQDYYTWLIVILVFFISLAIFLHKKFDPQYKKFTKKLDLPENLYTLKGFIFPLCISFALWGFFQLTIKESDYSIHLIMKNITYFILMQCLLKIFLNPDKLVATKLNAVKETPKHKDLLKRIYYDILFYFVCITLFFIAKIYAGGVNILLKQHLKYMYNLLILSFIVSIGYWYFKYFKSNAKTVKVMGVKYKGFTSIMGFLHAIAWFLVGLCGCITLFSGATGIDFNNYNIALTFYYFIPFYIIVVAFIFIVYNYLPRISKKGPNKTLQRLLTPYSSLLPWKISEILLYTPIQPRNAIWLASF